MYTEKVFKTQSHDHTVSQQQDSKPRVKGSTVSLEHTMWHSLHAEWRLVKEAFPQPDLVGILIQGLSLPLHQYLLLCQAPGWSGEVFKKI